VEGLSSFFLNIELMSLNIAIELETTARKIINNERYMSFLVEIPWVSLQLKNN
jgi:hypothetical protein